MAGDFSSLSKLSTERLRLLVRVARLYHEEGLRQPDIADHLHLSQSRVSRLLKEAGDFGIIRTIVVSPPGVYAEVEAAVRQRFELRDVVIVDSDGEDEVALLPRLGAAGAVYLDATLSSDDVVGVSSWSSTLVATVDAMSPRSKSRASDVVQLLGGVGTAIAQVQATHLADRFAQVTGGLVHYLPTPGVVASAAIRDALFSDPSISQVIDMWERLSVVLVGIGSLEPSPLLQSSGNSISDVDRRELRSVGAVGDVCLNFYDATGRRVDAALHQRVVGIDRDTLMQVPRRLGIAGGERKFESILGAAQGRWIDVLITDLGTARRLLDVPLRR